MGGAWEFGVIGVRIWLDACLGELGGEASNGRRLSTDISSNSIIFTRLKLSYEASH